MRSNLVTILVLLSASFFAAPLTGCGSEDGDDDGNNNTGTDMGRDAQADDGEENNNDIDMAEDAGADMGDDVGEDLGAAGPTWSVEVAPFYQKYCVACHSTSPKDFTQYADVVAFSARSKCGIAVTQQDGCAGGPPPMQFPVGPGPFPSDEERNMVVEWIDSGTPE